MFLKICLQNRIILC